MVDIIIPHSNIDKYRERNLFFVVQYYKLLLPNSNIIIVEQNTKTDISEIKQFVDTHILVRCNNDLFCKSLLLNEGYKKHKNK